MEPEGNDVSRSGLGGPSNRLHSELFQTGKFTATETGQMDLILEGQEFQYVTADYGDFELEAEYSLEKGTDLQIHTFAF